MTPWVIVSRVMVWSFQGCYVGLNQSNFISNFTPSPAPLHLVLGCDAIKEKYKIPILSPNNLTY